MKKIYSVIKWGCLIGVLVFLVSSCKKAGKITTPSGLQYQFFEEKGGKKPKVGDIMKLHLSYRTMNDSVLYDSKVLGDSFLIELMQPLFAGGLEEGFALMGEGDSAAFVVSADSIFEKLFRTQLPPFMHKGDKMRFDVRLKQIINKAEFDKEQKEKNAAIEQNDRLQIENYLAQNSLPMEPVQPGFYFLTIKEGKGEHPKSGERVQIQYVGKLLTGEIFDSSSQMGKELGYILGAPEVPNVWNIATANLKVGGIYRVILDTKNRKGLMGTNKLKNPGAVYYDVELTKIGQ